MSSHETFQPIGAAPVSDPTPTEVAPQPVKLGWRYGLSALVVVGMLLLAFLAAIGTFGMALIPAELVHKRPEGPEILVGGVFQCIFALIALAGAAGIRKFTRNTRGRILQVTGGVALAANILSVVAFAGLSGPRSAAAATAGPTVDRADAEALANYAENYVAQREHPDSAPPAPAPAGDLNSEYLRLQREFLDGCQQEAMVYRRNLEPLHLENLLAPEHLGSAEDINHQLANCRKAMEFLDTAEACLNRRYSVYQQALKTRYSAAAYQQAAGALERDIASPYSVSSRTNRHEREIYQEAEAILSELAQRPGRFDPRTRRLTLKSNDDLNFYNDACARVVSISQRQQQVQDAGRERARVWTEWLRTYAKTGERTPEPAVSVIPPSAGVRIDLASDAPVIKKNAITFPLGKSALVASLGTPNRTVHKDLDYLIWDNLGIVAIAAPAEKSIRSVVICLNTADGQEVYPRASYEGPLTLDSATIHDTESPRSINRQLHGDTFTAADAARTTWTMPRNGYSLFARVGQGGLIDTIVIGPREPAAQK